LDVFFDPLARRQGSLFESFQRPLRVVRTVQGAVAPSTNQLTAFRLLGEVSLGGRLSVDFDAYAHSCLVRSDALRQFNTCESNLERDEHGNILLHGN